MRTVITALVTVSLVIAGSSRVARACSCVRVSDADDMKQADQVFLARASKERRVGQQLVQRLDVLHVLKGKPGKRFTLKRASNTICDRSFRDKEVALVFARRGAGAVSICAGNYDLKAVQLERMASYIKLSRVRTATPNLVAMQAALATALKGYLHDRPRVPVRYKPLAGQQARVGTSTLRFGDKRLKHAAEIRTALSSGPVLYVAGRYHREGYNFRVLLLHTGRGRFETLARWGAETKSTPIPTLTPLGARAPVPISPKSPAQR